MSFSFFVSKMKSARGTFSRDFFFSKNPSKKENFESLQGLFQLFLQKPSTDSLMKYFRFFLKNSSEIQGFFEKILYGFLQEFPGEFSLVISTEISPEIHTWSKVFGEIHLEHPFGDPSDIFRDYGRPSQNSYIHSSLFINLLGIP